MRDLVTAAPVCAGSPCRWARFTGVLCAHAPGHGHAFRSSSESWVNALRGRAVGGRHAGSAAWRRAATPTGGNYPGWEGRFFLPGWPAGSLPALACPFPLLPSRSLDPQPPGGGLDWLLCFKCCCLIGSRLKSPLFLLRFLQASSLTPPSLAAAALPSPLPAIPPSALSRRITGLAAWARVQRQRRSQSWKMVITPVKSWGRSAGVSHCVGCGETAASCYFSR